MVYYLDLLAHSGNSPLPMNRIILAAIRTMLVRTLGRKLDEVGLQSHASDTGAGLSAGGAAGGERVLAQRG